MASAFTPVVQDWDTISEGKSVKIVSLRWFLRCASPPSPLKLRRIGGAGAGVRGDLSGPGAVHTARGDRFVQVNVSVADLDIETAIRIGANPRFVMDCCSLPAVVRQWYELTYVALQALRNDPVFHEYLLPDDNDQTNAETMVGQSISLPHQDLQASEPALLTDF